MKNDLLIFPFLYLVLNCCLLMCFFNYIFPPLLQASRIMQKLVVPDTGQDASTTKNDGTAVSDETSKLESWNLFSLPDYSDLFGEEFRMPDVHWDCSHLNILDIGAVEEGILHVLFACASQVCYFNVIYNF